MNAPRPWPPEACDEVRHHLQRYGWAREPESVVDDLFDILHELDEWLADSRAYGKRLTRTEEWRSLIEDVAAAWDQAGPAVRDVLVSMPELLQRLRPNLGSDRPERDALRGVLRQVWSEAGKPPAAPAAFDDLVLAVQDPDFTSERIRGRVDVLDSILRFGGRALTQVHQTLSGVLDNDPLSVAFARHEMDGEDLSEHRSVGPEGAALSEEERIALARRWCEFELPPARNVVWLFYGGARLGHWRLEIGSCEFFSGPDLLNAMAEVDAVRQSGDEYPGTRPLFNTVPEELMSAHGLGEFIRDAQEWPDQQDWVGVRVDLGNGRVPNLEQTARDEVEAIVALATFDRGGTTWRPLTGYKAFRDGEPAGSSMPFRERDSDRRWVAADRTHEWLDRNADRLARRALLDPAAHEVVAAASALNDAVDASPIVRLLEAVRSVETEASALGLHWKVFTKSHVIPGSALSSARSAAFDVLSELAGRHELYRRLPYLRGLTDEFVESTGDGLMRLNVGRAYMRLRVLEDLPIYHGTARRARDVSSSLSTPTTASAYITRQRLLQERLVNRAARVRNSLTHGGPRNDGVTKTAADFMVNKAQTVAGLSIWALLEGKPLAAALAEHQTAVSACLDSVPLAPSVYDALYGLSGDQRD